MRVIAMLCVERPRKKRPKGPPLPTPEGWKDDVRRKLSETGMTKMRLAELVGVTPATITNMLDEELNQQSSVCVRPVSEILGIPLPSNDPELDELTREMRELTPEQRAVIRQTMSLFRKPR